MSKNKKRRQPIQKTEPPWPKIFGGLMVISLILFFILSNRGRSAIETAFSGTPTPTATATLTASPTLSPSPTAVVTATHSPTPSPIPVSVATNPPVTPLPEGIPVYSYDIINTYPHDVEAFTQGLIFEDGILYEGTGLRGNSTLRKVNLTDGMVLQQVEIPAEYFAEGITVFGDKLYQLTWQSNVGFVYDKGTFEKLAEFEYPTQGWGLTHDGEHLIMSDGTATLHFLDPETLQEVGQVEVTDNQTPVTFLNELEYIEGEIYANIWKTERIARINPETGQVLAWIDLPGLLTAEERQKSDVLNGIAYDATTDRLFVTGKWWPYLFEIDLVLGE